jgi:hypothetical protein
MPERLCGPLRFDLNFQTARYMDSNNVQVAVRVRPYSLEEGYDLSQVPGVYKLQDDSKSIVVNEALQESEGSKVGVSTTPSISRASSW